MINSPPPSIRQLALLLESVISIFQAVSGGKMHYRSMEKKEFYIEGENFIITK